MKFSPVYLGFFLLLFGCMPNTDKAFPKSRQKCVISDYVLPPVSGSPLLPNDSDSGDDLFDLRVDIPGKDMASFVPGFQARQGNLRNFLYLTFVTPKDPVYYPEADVVMITEHGDLFKLAGKSEYSWKLVEKENGVPRFWGACSSHPISTDICLVTMNLDGFSINYEINQVNLKVYDKIEEFVRQQLEVCGLDPRE